MSELAVRELGYDNREHPKDPYKFIHPFGPSLYQTHSESGEWYFYFEGREIHVTLDQLKQLLQMKTEIEIAFNYGGWHISFAKTFDLPFAPFYDLWLYDGIGDDAEEVRLENNEYTTTIISYHVEEKLSSVLIRNWWKKPVRDDVIDHLLRSFKIRGWERTDYTDVTALKELMHKNYSQTV